MDLGAESTSGGAAGDAGIEIVCGWTDIWVLVTKRASLMRLPKVNAVPVKIARVKAVWIARMSLSLGPWEFTSSSEKVS